ncbi:hypothetical protein Pcinc_018867 [Petrolisthes cinctipes]|uniref:Protein MCM10 homolog n=1 Tax=Petrolisthes cinctipes TaxID=88211 RepID=A0AAE1FLA1_PETCI|nr:hypothetical protein Pcinc_018867 [Petrolisthes cinctipes]
MAQSGTAGSDPGSSSAMESAAEFEDLDTLIDMIDGDFEDDGQECTPSSATIPSPVPTSSTLPLHSTSPSTLPSHSSTSHSSTPTAAELGLVLSDDEDQPTVSTSSSKKSKFGEAFSQSKFSKKLPTESSTSQDYPENYDPLETELQEMEKRVKTLKQQLSKKRKFDGEESSSSKRFSKLTNVISQGEKTQTTRTLSTEETTRLYSKLKRNSLLHRGDTDSEDEEDNRNPMEQQYNDCGRDMKRRIAHESSQTEDRERERVLARVKRKEQLQTGGGKSGEPQSQGWKSTSGSLVALKNGGSALPDTDKNVATDFYSGIRIVNPLVSSDAMQERMAARKMVRMSTIQLHIRGGEIEGDWVTIGVLVSKSDPKTSQKGSQYCIWKLSDLSDCTKTVALFLFSGAHKAMWKSSIGTVIGLLNPTIMKERRSDNFNSSDVLSLSIFDAQRVMMMGSSKDLGWCKGTTKQNQRCKSFVNKASCEFCVYHIQREYQKTSAKRSDIQSSFTRVDPKRRLQEKVLGKDQVFYGGQLYTAPAPAASVPKQVRANKGKDLATLNSLKMKLKTEQLKEEDKRSSFVLKHLSDGEISAVQGVAQKNDLFSERLLAPTPGARNLLKHMVQDETEKKVQTGQLVSVSAKDLLNMTHQEAQARRRQQPPQRHPLLSSPQSPAASTSAIKRPSLSSPKAGPQLGRGILPGADIDLEISPPKKINMAKAQAVAILKKTGGIQAKNPNAVMNRKKAGDPKFLDKVQKQLSTSLKSDKEESQTSKLTAAMTEDTSRSKLQRLDINSEKFKAMLDKKSRHTNLIDAVENEALDKYYQGLEKKEMLEEKLQSVMEIPVTAYACMKCKYLAESASEFCREENHPLKPVKTKKRFFECKNCKRRTSSLDKLPRKACPNCEQSSWQRVCMGKVKKGPRLDSEILSLRGDELKHYSGSSNQIFLNI